MKRDTIILIVISVVVIVLTLTVMSFVLLETDPKSPRDYYDELQNLNNLFSSIHRVYPTLRTPVDIPVLYINLDRCPERRAWIEKQGEQYGFAPIRVTGVDGDNDPSVTYRNTYPNLSRSEIGCTLSHIRAIEMAYNMGLTRALIVEDDASFVVCPYWPHTLSEYITRAPLDWTILRLFSNGSYSEDKEYLTFTSHKDMATAYILNREGMKNVLDQCVRGKEYILSSADVQGEADRYIYLISPYQCMYYINPPLIVPDNRTLRSTIHDDHSSAHHKLSSKALHLHLDRVLTQALTRGKSDREGMKLLYQPMSHQRCQREPTALDIVVSVREMDELDWLEPILTHLTPSRYRLFLYVRGRIIPQHKSADEIITLNNIGGAEAAFAYHIYNTKEKSERILCLDDRSRAQEVALSSDIRSYKMENLKHYTYPTYPTPTLRVSPAPVSLKPLGRWYEIVAQTKIETCPVSKVLLTSSHPWCDEDTWYRILLSLSYAREPETACYLRKVWCGLFRTNE